MEYICPTCLDSYSSKRTLKKHMDGACLRKMENRLKKQCPHCLDVFASRQMMQLHVDNGVCTKNPQPIEEKIPKIQIKLKKPIEEQLDYSNMSKDELIARLKLTENKQPSIVNNTINNNIVNNTIICILQPYKALEDVSKYVDILGNKTFVQLLTHDLDQSIPNLCSKIHNNDDHNELRNIYISSENSKFVHAFNGKNFETRDRDTYVSEMLDGKRNLFGQYIEKHGESLSQRTRDNFERHQNKIDSDEKYRKYVEHNIGGALFDMRGPAKKHEKMLRDQEKNRK